jgi:capsular exopolysaccharide synthesis family protein
MRWAWLWLVAMALAGIASYRVSSDLPKVYQAQTKLLVGSSDLTSGAGEFSVAQTASQITATYSQVITTSPVLEAALAAGGFDLSPSAVAGLVSAAPVTGTQLIQITVRAADPDFAAKFANLVAAAFMQRIEASQTGRYAAVEESLARQVDQLAATQDALTRQVADLQAQPPSTVRDEALAPLQFQLTQAQASYTAAQRSYQDVLLAKARSTNPITVVEPATPPTEAIQPQVRQNVLVAAGLGLLIALGAAYLVELLDDRLRSADRVQRLTGMPPLGTIPRVQAGGNSAGAAEIASAFQLLSANVMSALAGREFRAILVTNTSPGDGATTIAVNLALTVAQSGRRVILVDADVAQPSLQHLFGIRRHTGLTSLLANPQLAVAKLLAEGHFPGLWVLPAGSASSEASALGSEHMQRILTELRELADVVVVDAPGVPGPGGAAALATWVDGVVFVADARRTHASFVRTAATVLRGMGANVLGLVLNKAYTASGVLPSEPLMRAAEPETARRLSAGRHEASERTPASYRVLEQRQQSGG